MYIFFFFERIVWLWRQQVLAHAGKQAENVQESDQHVVANCPQTRYTIHKSTSAPKPPEIHINATLRSGQIHSPFNSCHSPTPFCSVLLLNIEVRVVASDAELLFPHQTS